jgi:tetratricopeptide (TPR) repeat protein
VDKRHEEKLPAYERSLLDIYVDLWSSQEIEEAFTKLEVHVRDYPDDKEAKSVLGIIVGQLTKDTARTVQIFEEILEQDPGYRLALTFYSGICAASGKVDKAIELMHQLLRYHPKSLDARRQLAQLYERKGQTTEAIEVLQPVLRESPDNPEVLMLLYRINLKAGEFEKAADYLEMLRSAHADDPFQMQDYYYRLSRFVSWQGRFREALGHMRSSLSEALRTGDSSLIANQYVLTSNAFQFFEMPDSAAHYARQAGKYQSGFQLLNCPVQMVSIDSKYAEEMTPIFESAINEAKAKFPETIWGLLDAVSEMFYGQCDADTARVISGLRRMVESGVGGGATNELELGVALAEFGEYEEALPILLKYSEGEFRTRSGRTYPRLQHLLGICYEGLGQPEKAIARYEEMLSYWNDADIQLEIIKDARMRLARLKSQS